MQYVFAATTMMIYNGTNPLNKISRKCPKNNIKSVPTLKLGDNSNILYFPTFASTYSFVYFDINSLL